MHHINIIAGNGQSSFSILDILIEEIIDDFIVVNCNIKWNQEAYFTSSKTKNSIQLASKPHAIEKQ